MRDVVAQGKSVLFIVPEHRPDPPAVVARSTSCRANATCPGYGTLAFHQPSGATTIIGFLGQKQAVIVGARSAVSCSH